MILLRLWCLSLSRFHKHPSLASPCSNTSVRIMVVRFLIKISHTWRIQFYIQVVLKSLFVKFLDSDSKDTIKIHITFMVHRSSPSSSPVFSPLSKQNIPPFIPRYEVLKVLRRENYRDQSHTECWLSQDVKINRVNEIKPSYILLP